MRSARSRVILAKAILRCDGQRSVELSAEGSVPSLARVARVGRVDGYEALAAEIGPWPRRALDASAAFPPLASSSRKAPTAPITPVASAGRNTVDPFPSANFGSASKYLRPRR